MPFRAGLLDALAKFLDKKLVTEHFNKRCISVTPSTVNASRTVLHFTDGTTHETDVVIGADGIKSVIFQIRIPYRLWGKTVTDHDYF